jgi:long-chain fatty acid transport protein
VRLSRAVALAVLLLIVPSAALASPQDLLGYGGRSPGLAMTGVSFSDDFEAAYLNPAGRVRARRRSLTLGVSAAVFALEIDGGREPAEVLLRGEVKFPEVVQFPVLSRAQVIALQVGLGFDFHGIADGLRVGASMSALADLTGDLVVRLDETNSFTSQVETQLLSTFSPIVGASYTRGAFDFGLVYRHRLESHMSLEVDVRDLPVDVPHLSVGGLVQYDPPEVAAEASWRVNDHWRLALQGTYRAWSDWPGPQQKTTRNSTIAPDPEFSDTLSPRIAVEHTATDGALAVRCGGGYAYEPTPAPPARMAAQRDRDGEPRVTSDGEPVLVPLRYIDGDRHLLTAGVGAAWTFEDGVRIRFDAHGELHVMVPRTHEVAAPGRTANMESSGIVLGGGFTMGAEW